MAIEHAIAETVLRLPVLQACSVQVKQYPSRFSALTVVTTIN